MSSDFSHFNTTPSFLLIFSSRRTCDNIKSHKLPQMKMWKKKNSTIFQPINLKCVSSKIWQRLFPISEWFSSFNRIFDCDNISVTKKRKWDHVVSDSHMDWEGHFLIWMHNKKEWSFCHYWRFSQTWWYSKKRLWFLKCDWRKSQSMAQYDVKFSK